MKILHLSSESSWRGGEQQIAYLLEESVRLGINIVVACRTGAAFAQRCQDEGWPYYPLSFKNSFDLATAWAIKKICQNEAIDLVHVHSAKSQGVAVLAATLGNSTPLILSRRVDFPIRQNRMTRWKYNHPKVVKIISVSHAIDNIVRSSVLHPERCVTVHSGVDPDRFVASTGYLRKTFKVPADTLLIGNTSALADHKDYPTFVEAAKVFKQTGIRAKFLIIGDGSLREAVRQDIARHQLEEDVLMTGFLENLDEVLPELDFFLMTSKTEGLGTSVLDAFSCRVPVVATRAGGIPEMVVHEQTGLLAEVGDANTLAAHLNTLVNNPGLVQQLTEAAHRHLLRHFTKARMAQKTVEVYRSVLPPDYRSL